MPVPAALGEANQPQARYAHVLHDALDVAAGEDRDAVAPPPAIGHEMPPPRCNPPGTLLRRTRTPGRTSRDAQGSSRPGSRTRERAHRNDTSDRRHAPGLVSRRSLVRAEREEA